MSNYLKFKLGTLITKAVLVFASLCSTAHSQPKLSISVNRSTVPGAGVTVNKDEPVNLEITTDPSVKLAVFVVPKINYDATSDGRRVIFFAKRSVVFLVAAFDTQGNVTQQEFTVTVGNVPVPPIPDPVIPPGPAPDVPTSVIGKAAYDAAMKIPNPPRVADAVVLAKELRAAHSKAKAVATMAWKDVLQSAMDPFGKLPAATKALWTPWGLAMIGVYQKEITGTDAEKRTKAIDAIQEIAKAMEAVR